MRQDDVKLNPPLAFGYGEREVRTFAVSADGAFVLYTADQETTGVVELFTRPLDGTKPARKLSGLIHAPGGSVQGFSFRTSGTYAVYLADSEHDDVFELYGVPLDGSGPAIKLHPDLDGTRDVMPDFRLDASGKRVVFRANLSSSQVDLFSVPAAGGAASQLDALPAGGGVTGFVLAPDGETVVYSRRVGGRLELDAAPVDGRVPAVRLDAGLSGDVAFFRISPDGQRVLFLLSAAGSLTLFGAPIDGSKPPVRLIGSVQQSWSNSFEPFEIAPDSLHVVVSVDEDPSPSVSLALYSLRSDGPSQPLRLGSFGGLSFQITPDSRRVIFSSNAGLFSVSLRGRGVRAENGEPQAVLLSRSIATGARVLESAVTPTSDRVVFVVRQPDGFTTELFSAPLDGSADAVKLNGPLAGRGVGQDAGPTQTFAFSPDGRRVAYWADQDEDGLIELYCVPSDGSAAPWKLNGPLAPGPDDAFHVGSPSCAFTPDGSTVVFRLDVDAPGILELYAVRADGGQAARKVNRSLVHTVGDVYEFAIAPDGSRAVYRADGDANDVLELYSVSLGAQPESIKLNGPLVPGGIVGEPPVTSNGAQDFWISADSRRVVYRADADCTRVKDLYSAPLDGSEPAVRLDPTNPPSACTAVVLTPNGARVLYLADEGVSLRELRSAPIDGSSPPLTLTDPGVSVSGAAFQLAPDSSRVVYLARAETAVNYELYSVPVEGGSSVRLTDGGGSSPSISANSRRVVFVASTLGQLEIRSVPIDGTSPPVVLARVPVGRSLTSLVLAPLGDQVVFLADLDAQQVFELYAVPDDGSSPARKLNPPLTGSRDVGAFALTPSASRVVYVADQDTNDAVRLYSVPLDGSGGPVLLTPDIGVNHAVSSFQIGRVGERVVYVANPEVLARRELFSVPADGSNAPVPLGATLPVNGSFRLSEDGSWVAFTADTSGTGELDLFRCRSDGSSLPISVSPPAPPLGGLKAELGRSPSFLFTPGASDLVYRAALDVPDVQELHLSCSGACAVAGSAPPRAAERRAP